MAGPISIPEGPRNSAAPETKEAAKRYRLRPKSREETPKEGSDSARCYRTNYKAPRWRGSETTL